MYVKTNNHPTERYRRTFHSLLVAVPFDLPILSTVESRGRRNWSLLPHSDIMHFERMVVASMKLVLCCWLLIIFRVYISCSHCSHFNQCATTQASSSLTVAGGLHLSELPSHYAEKLEVPIPAVDLAKVGQLQRLICRSSDVNFC